MSVVVFIVTHVIGDPARLLLPLDATEAQYQSLRQTLGLDDPLFAQFGRYFGDALQGDLGVSFWRDEPALPLALSHVWPTVQLGVAAVALGAACGIPAGFLAASRMNGPIDRAVSAISMLAVSVANFWLSLMLILVFAVELQWLPTSGYGSPQNLVLPALAVAAYPFGSLTQIARASLIEQLGQPYMEAARARGLSRRRAVALHASRNAMIPIVTSAGFEFARIVAGVLVVETIFNWPGIGNLTYQALAQQDYPLIQACVLVIAVMILSTNLLVDFVYGVIDPRVRA